MTKLKSFKKYIDDNLKNFFIISSSLLTKTFILFVLKSNNNLHFCVNYRNLNVIFKKNHYFISLIKQLLNRLMKIQIFIKFDIRSVYNAICIKKIMNEKSHSNVNINITNIK